MATQTKVFIELSDVIGLRMECGMCGTTVTLPIKRDMGFDGVQHCPSCGRAWLSFDKTTFHPQLKACIEAIRVAAEGLKGWQDTLETIGGGLTLSLQIKSENEDDEEVPEKK